MLINDSQRLAGAQTRFNSEIKTYDDGYGKLYIMRDSTGIVGIVRARTWEDAYGICEDEFFPEAEETIEEIVKEYGFKREHVKIIHPAYEKAVYINSNDKFWIDYSKEKPAEMSDYVLTGGMLLEGQFVRWETKETPDLEAWADNELFQEAFGFRPNGPNTSDTQKHGIYARDLNGELLDMLTEKMVTNLGILIITEGE
jgi:hypothetical protein